MIEVTEAAALKIKEALEAQAQEHAAIRVVTLGAEYETPQLLLALDHDQKDADTVVVSRGVRLLFDQDSAGLAANGCIDYCDDRLRSGFVLYNTTPAFVGCGPNCSCA